MDLGVGRNVPAPRLCAGGVEMCCICVHSKLRHSVQSPDKDVSYSDRLFSYGHMPIRRQTEVTRLTVQSLHGEFLSVTTSRHQLQGYEMVSQKP